MRKKKKQLYNIKNLLATGARYLIPLGMRSNGKSYQAKLVVLTAAFKEKVKFVYLRRWQDDIKQAYVEEYFSDMPIAEITDNMYTTVVAFQGFLYFANLSEDGHPIKGTQIGRYCALNIDTRYKSQAFVNYKFIVYEEFITDGAYLANEPTRLQQFVSTVARLESLQVIMIGNTISRVCPYFREWNLSGTLRQKQGTIEIYHLHGENDTVVDIAVENCNRVENDNNMFFGSAAKQIVTGEWDVKQSPRLPKPLDDYDICYRLDAVFSLLVFKLMLLIDDSGQTILFIYPGREPKQGRRLITDDFIDSPNVSRALRRNSRAELKMMECWQQGKVCYSDNLTAADFANTNAQYHIF